MRYMYLWNGFIIKVAELVSLIAFNFPAVLSFFDVVLIGNVELKTSFLYIITSLGNV